MNPFVTTRQGGATVLRVEIPNFDASVVGEFRRVLAECMAARGPIIVDLSAVEFVDTSGLSALRLPLGGARPRAVSFAGVSRRLAAGLARVPPQQLPVCHGTLAEALAACHMPSSRAGAVAAFASASVTMS